MCPIRVVHARKPHLGRKNGSTVWRWTCSLSRIWSTRESRLLAGRKLRPPLFTAEPSKHFAEIQRKSESCWFEHKRKLPKSNRSVLCLIEWRLKHRTSVAGLLCARTIDCYARILARKQSGKCQKKALFVWLIGIAQHSRLITRSKKGKIRDSLRRMKKTKIWPGECEWYDGMCVAVDTIQRSRRRFYLYWFAPSFDWNSRDTRNTRICSTEEFIGINRSAIFLWDQIVRWRIFQYENFSMCFLSSAKERFYRIYKLVHVSSHKTIYVNQSKSIENESNSRLLISLIIFSITLRKKNHSSLLHPLLSMSNRLNFSWAHAKTW